MLHVDPASSDFEKLPRHQQALIYSQMGWTFDALLEEFGVTEITMVRWLNPAAQQRHLAIAKRYRESEHGKRKAREANRLYYASPAGRAVRDRYNAKRRAQYAALRQQRGEPAE